MFFKSLTAEKTWDCMAMYLDGTYIRIDASGVCSFGSAQRDGSAFVCEERVNRELDFGAQPPFRLLAYHTMLEL